MRLGPMTAEWRQHTRNHPSVVMATLSLLVFTLLWQAIESQSAATTVQGRRSEVVPANSSASPLSPHPSKVEEVPEAEGEGESGEATEEEVGEFEEGDEANELDSAFESASPMAPSPMAPSSTRAAHSPTMVSAGSGANASARTKPAVQPVDNSHHHLLHHYHQQHSKALAQTGATGAATSTGTSHKEVRSSSDKATAHHSPNEDAAKLAGVSDSQSHYKNDTVVEDLFGNLVKLDGAPARPASHPVGSTARDLGMFAFKTLLLGPLIGITLKGALIRGLVWAMISYTLHLMFPALLATLGLGTGLVGFARQLQPEYAQLLLPQLAQLPQTFQHLLPQTFQHLLPQSIGLMTSQYMKLFAPVIESISSIPEESCRHRAVCEVASYLIQNSPFMSNSLQRISATVYVNFGTDYSKAWLDGIVQSDCALKYAQCPSSPFSLMASKLVEALRSANLQNMGSAASAGGTTTSGGMSAASAVGQAAVSQARNFFSF